MAQLKPKLKLIETEQENPSIKFLLEEYRNIAATHDRLRDIINHTLYYFLLLVAVPFTVSAIVFQDNEFDILKLPNTLALLVLTIDFGILCLSLALISARYRQNQYAKTVNRIRAFFANRDDSIKPYLFLPTSESLPKTTDLGHSFWYLLLMTAIGVSYAGLAGFSLFNNQGITGLAFGASYLIILYVFYRLIRQRYMKPSSKN